MIDYKNVDLVGLQQVYEAGAARPPHLFDMQDWAQQVSYGHNYPCGTACCLVGSFCEQYPEDDLHLRPIYRQSSIIDSIIDSVFIGYEVRLGRDYSKDYAPGIEVSKRFNLPEYAVYFLFINHHILWPYGRANLQSISAGSLSQVEALKRLQNTIRYLQRKAALIEEHEWYTQLSKREKLQSPQYFGEYNANKPVLCEG